MDNNKWLTPGAVVLAALVVAVALFVSPSDVTFDSPVPVKMAAGGAPPEQGGIAGPEAFQTSTYFTNGGDKFIVASGGEIEIQSGGTFDLQSGATIDFSGGVDLDGALLDFDADGNTSMQADTDNQIDVEINGADDFKFTANTFTALSGSTIAANTVAETTAASGVTVDGLTLKDGGVQDSAGLDVVGIADTQQVVVTGYTTQTNALLVLEDSGNTDIFAFAGGPPAAGSSGDLLDITDTWSIMDGSDTGIGIDLNLTSANHTGTGNTLTAIDLDLTSPDADATEVALAIDDTDWDTGIKSALNLEHIGLPTVASYAFTYTAAAGGTLNAFTIGDGEIWLLHDVRLNVTTNFDCTGDDCTATIGDGGDVDGLCVLTDTELQTADTEGTGWPAGWQCQVAATRGVYIDGTGGFIYAPSGSAETIDVILAAVGNDFSAGAATLYITYTRIQ